MLIAQMARERLRLDRVLLIISARPPHKRSEGLASGRHRLEMARRAARGLEGIDVSDIEFRRAGPSYPVETVERLGRRHRGASMTLIVGQDTLAELAGWYEAPRLLRRVRLAVYRRPGQRARSAHRVRWIDGPPMDISAREVRSRLRRGRPIRFWVPRPVEKYIYSTGLYR